MKLSLIVPIYNEAKHLEKFIRKAMKTPIPLPTEWIFVDDCSTDHSYAILERLSGEFKFKLFRQPQNGGKGSAVKRGFEEATGELVLIQDADFEYDPSDIPALIQPISDGVADVVYGSRFKPGVLRVHRTYHFFVNWLLTALSNLLSGVFLTDMETCYKLFRTDLVKSMILRSQRFGIEVELTAYVAKTKARIYEVPIRYYPRTRLQGKKINWKDGFAALWHLVRFNLLISFDEAFKNPPEWLTLDSQQQNYSDGSNESADKKAA